MTVNEMMIRHNFITKIILRDKDKELSKDLKVKIMSMRIELGKLRRQVEDDLQEAISQLTPSEYRELASKSDLTQDEREQIKEWNKQITEEYNTYLDQRSKDEVADCAHFNEDEYAQIVEVNAANDVEIIGQKLCAADFLEVLHSLFVVQ